MAVKAKKSAGALALRKSWRQSYPGLTAVFVFSALINVLRLAIPLYIFQLLDRVLSSRSIETLLVLTVITVSAVVTLALADFIRRWMLIRWGAWIERRFGRDLFLAGLTRRGEPKAGKAVRDLGQIRQFVSGSGAVAWLDVIWAPAFVFAVYLLHPLIALIAAVAIAIMLALGIFNEVLTRGARSAATEASSERTDWLTTAERNVGSVGALNIAPQLADRWQSSSSTRLDENMRTRLTSLFAADTMRFTENVQRIASYGLGVWLVIGGEITVGAVIAAAILGRIASGMVRRAMVTWRYLASAGSAYRRVRALLVEPDAVPVPPLAQGVALPLHVDGVGHRYDDQSRAVFRHVELTLEPGELLAIIGPSGSGKSTLTAILSGNLEPKFGAVRLGDTAIHRYPREMLNGYMSYLEQETRLFRGTIEENIAGLGEADRSLVVEAAKKAGIHDVIVQLADGYETEVAESGGVLSGGERKRIALARAFHGAPSLIILDEPEANLDRTARQALTAALRSAKRDGAVVIVTAQTDSLVSIADKAIRLDESLRPEVFADAEALREERRRRRNRAANVVAVNERS